MTETIEQPAQTAIAEYSPTAAALAHLRARLDNVAYDLTTGKGMDVAKKDRAEVRGLRVALEAKRVELKAPALERSRLIDAEAKALTAELVALEHPIDAQIKAEEGRKAAEKAAREEVERQAAAKVQECIDAIRESATFAIGKSAEVIAKHLQLSEGIEITLEEFGDRAGEASQVKAKLLEQLRDLHASASAHEAEQARMEAERAELAKQRAEQEAREKAERERIAVEQKAAAEKLAAERATFEAEQATARAEAKKRDDADRARRNEEDRLAREARAAEDKRISEARAALEAEQRAIREAAEAKEAEARRIAQEAADAAAAAERKRLDDEATAARAEQQRKGEEREKAMAAQQRLRDAAPTMLHALEMVRDAYDDCQRDGIVTIPDIARKVIGDAIKLATGEEK